MAILDEVKGVVILKSVGWKTKEIIHLRLFQNLIIATTAYMVGVILAYVYVYVFDGVVLRDIFLGYENIDTDVSFTPVVDTDVLLMIFLMFCVPFLLSVVIPLWRVCIKDIDEIQR